jgi:PhnB protein
MAKRPAKPEGFPWVSPYLIVKDADAALDFYQRAFGFETRMKMPGPDGRTGHAEMAYKDAVIMLGPENDMQKAKAPATTRLDSPVGVYIYCDDVDALFDRATKAGAKSVQAPKDEFWGDRRCRMSDPNGYVWDFATNVAEFNPANMPK